MVHTEFPQEERIRPYWANTSGNSLISYELRIADNRIKYQMEGLLNGGTVKTVIDEQIIFSQLEENAEAIWSLFLPAIVIEFKVFDPKKEKTLDETADRVLTQIREKKYDAGLI